MCYSANLSLLSFSFGLFASFMLINFGNKQSESTNKVIGYFYLFVTLMQFVEYLLWIDIDCANGLNRVGSYLGPILNHLQPIVLLILASTFLKSANVISPSIIISVNIIYLIYCVYQYVKYVTNKSNLCVRTNNCNHLDWTWKKDFKYLFFHTILFINIANFYNNKNLIVSMVISYVLFLISFLGFKQNAGEFWCLMVTGIPLINLFMEKVLNINN